MPQGVDESAHREDALERDLDADGAGPEALDVARDARPGPRSDDSGDGTEGPAEHRSSLHAAEAADEAQLLERLRRGDEDAFAHLVNAYGGRMLAAARRILLSEEDAQEAVQEAFLSAFRSLERFEGQSRIGTWLHRIAINSALMRLRSARRRHEIPIDDLLPAYTESGHFREPPSSWGEGADQALLRDEAREVVRQRIEQLPDIYRIALVLRDIEGLDNEEVAQSLGVTVNAAKIRVHRARQALKTLLDPYVNGVRP